MERLLTLSGTRLAEMIRKKEITSLEAVKIHIEHIKKVNPLLNAVVKDRFDAAIEEAKDADRRVKDSPPEALPPFHGVPCTVKECFMLTGMPNTSGLVARRDVIPDQDATAVSRLRKSGAIALGVTNVPELCMWMETDNRLYGRTNNPYNQRRIVGGSSGGEGAIIGAGGSPFGVGSDIGGSIRMPAFFNGVFGHKATGGLVPNTGQHPIARNQALKYLTTGPLVRRAEDLMPLLRLMAGPDGKDAGCIDMQIGNIADVKIKGLTVIDVEDNGTTRVSDDLKKAQRKAAVFLEGRGATVKRTKIAGLKRSLDIWSSMLSASDQESFSMNLGNGTPIRPLFEMIKWATRVSKHTLPSIILAASENLPKYMPSRTKRFVEAGINLREELVKLIGANGIMLYPSYSRPAPEHKRPLLTPFDWVYTAILNMMELPVTQVPLGLNDGGIPLGMQVVSVHGNDHVTIAVALELEKAFGGWVQPHIGLLKDM
jgi:fatty acid amide hydrolase 2